MPVTPTKTSKQLEEMTGLSVLRDLSVKEFLLNVWSLVECNIWSLNSALQSSWSPSWIPGAWHSPLLACTSPRDALFSTSFSSSSQKFVLHQWSRGSITPLWDVGNWPSRTRIWAGWREWKAPNHSLSSSEMINIRLLRETLWNRLNLAERGFKILQPFFPGNKCKRQLSFLLLAEDVAAANICAG